MSLYESTQIAINGYTFLRRDCGARSGGVGLYIRANLQYFTLCSSDSIEQLWVCTGRGTGVFVISVVHRPPSLAYRNYIDELEI